MGIAQLVTTNNTKMKFLHMLLVLVTIYAAAVSAIEDEYQPDRNKFLIGVRRTAVVTTLSTSTVTVGSTCFTKVNTGTCSGKRKRRSLQDSIKISDGSLDGLESSQTGETAAILDPN